MVRTFIRVLKIGFGVVLYSLGMVAAANAQSITSGYTKIDLAQCPMLQGASDESTFGGSWLCRGYEGLPVYVAEGDLRMFVSFGPNAQSEPAARQTLPNFNTINETLEWRLRNGVPFATILRWFPSLDGGQKTGSVLIVSQYLPGGGTCQIARIDARANKNANVLARQAADTLAGRFDCNNPPQVIGNPGMLRW